MSKSDNTKKSLKNSIKAREALFDFIDANPKGNGQEALDYMIKRDISKENAVDTITEYSKAKEELMTDEEIKKMEPLVEPDAESTEDVSLPPADSTPTVKELDDKDPKVDVMPDIIPNNETENPLEPIVENHEKVNKLNAYKQGNNENVMSLEDSKKTEDAVTENDEEEEKPTVDEAGASDVPVNSPNCPPDQNWDSTKNQCVPVSTGPITKGAPAEAKAVSGYEGRINADIKSEKKRVAEYYKKLDKLEGLRNLKVADARIAAKERYLKEKKLDGMIRSAKQGVSPRARLVAPSSVKGGESASKVKKVSASEAEINGPVSWMTDVASEKNVIPSYVWKVDKQRIFEAHDQRFTKEFDGNDNVKYVPLGKSSGTETVTGPVSTDTMKTMSEQVLVLPDGKVVTPIRQFCETKVLPAGTKEAFFYDFGSVTFGAVVDGAVMADSAVVVRSAGGDATPRGTKLTIGYTQLEESPVDIVAAANRSYALESVNDESVEVLQRAFNIDAGSAGTAAARKAKGAGTKANRWVDNTGAQIAADAAGLGNMTFAALVAAKGVIEDTGLDPSNLVTYTSGKAIRDLIFDPDLDSFISFSRPAIITEATVERIAGTNVVRSSANAAGTQANSTRSCMFVPNIAFGLITGRDLTMEAQRRNEIQSVYLTGTQRVGGFVKNVEATCRISHL